MGMQMDFSPISVEQLSAPRRSLRIAIVTETFAPDANDVAWAVAERVAALRELNHDIQLVRPRRDPPAARAVGAALEGLPIARQSGLTAGWRAGLGPGRALLRLWTVRRPDLVHIATAGTLGWSALHAARKLRLPVCADFRAQPVGGTRAGDVSETNRPARRSGIHGLAKPVARLLRKFHQRTRLTIVPTESMCEELVRCGFRDVRFVAAGVDTSRFAPARREAGVRARWGVGERAPAILCSADVEPATPFDRVSATCAAMASQAPQGRVVLLGRGPCADALLARWPKIVVADVTTDRAIARASAEIWLQPGTTNAEAPLLQAMASGLAIACGAGSAAAAVIDDGASGLVVDSPAPAEFAEAVASLVRDPARRRRLGTAARAAALQRDWRRIALALEACYLGIVDSAVDTGAATSTENAAGRAAADARRLPLRSAARPPLLRPRSNPRSP